MPLRPLDGAVAGVLLAGGRSHRMGGGDKCLRRLGPGTLLDRVTAAVRPQVGPLILNANGDPARFGALGLPVVADVVTGQPGPLAGVLTGLEWARDHAPACRYVASFATDAPFLPADLVARLAAAVTESGAAIACAASGGREQPVFALWPVGLAADLRRALVDDGVRRVTEVMERHHRVVVEYATTPVDPFFNANRPEDLELAERLLAAPR